MARNSPLDAAGWARRGQGRPAGPPAAPAATTCGGTRGGAQQHPQFDRHASPIRDVPAEAQRWPPKLRAAPAAELPHPSSEVMSKVCLRRPCSCRWAHMLRSMSSASGRSAAEGSAVTA